MNNSSSIVALQMRARARQLDAKLNEAYVVLQIFGTEQAREVYRETYQNCIDAWASYWRFCNPKGFVAQL